MKKNILQLTDLSISGFLIYQVVWFWFFASIFGDMFALAITAGTFMAGIALGGHVFKIASNKIKSSSLFSYLHLAIGILGFVELIVLGKAALFYGNFFFALSVFLLLLIIHNLLIGAVNWVDLGISSHDRQFFWGALGVLIAGFILVPAAGLNTLLLPATLNLALYSQYKTFKIRKLKVDRRFTFEPFVRGILLSIYLVGLNFLLNLSLDSIHVFSLIAYTVLLGLIIGRERPIGGYKSNAQNLVITVGVTVVFISRIAQSSNGFFVMLSAVLIALPSWALASKKIGTGVFSLSGGAALGFFSSLILISFLGELFVLSIAMLLMTGTALFSLDLEKHRKTSVLALFFAFLLTFYVPTIAIQVDVSKKPTSPLALSFSEHIPNVLHPKKLAKVSHSFSFIGSKYDILVLNDPEIEDELYFIIENRLKEDGIFVQVFPLDTGLDEDFKGLVENTLAAFPHTSMWLVDKHAILISSRAHLVLDYVEMREKIQERAEIREDMGELFYPTRLTDITVVDVFTLMYFMEEEELREFSSGGAVGENALLWVFDFKKRKADSRFAVTVPPVVNGVSREGDEVVIEFLKLRARLDGDWTEESGIVGRYELIDNTTDYTISYEKSAGFLKGTTVIVFQAFQSRIIDVLEMSEPVAEILDQEVQAIGRKRFLDRGYTLTDIASDTVDGFGRYLLFGGTEAHEVGQHQARLIAMVWYCDSNSAVNVVTADYIGEDPEIEPIFDSVTCLDS
jgi:hypothetical protein